MKEPRSANGHRDSNNIRANRCNDRIRKRFLGRHAINDSVQTLPFSGLFADPSFRESLVGLLRSVIEGKWRDGSYVSEGLVRTLVYMQLSGRRAGKR